MLLHLLTHLLPKCTKYKFHDLSMALASLLWQIQEQKHIALSSFPARTLSYCNSPITIYSAIFGLCNMLFNKKMSARKPSKESKVLSPLPQKCRLLQPKHPKVLVFWTEFFYFHVLPILVHDVPSFLTTRNQKHTHSLSTTRHQKKTLTHHASKNTHTLSTLHFIVLWFGGRQHLLSCCVWTNDKGLRLLA